MAVRAVYSTKPYGVISQEITFAKIPKDFFHRFFNREELTRRKKKKLERQLEQDGWTRNQEGLVHQHVIVRFGETCKGAKPIPTRTEQGKRPWTEEQKTGS